MPAQTVYFGQARPQFPGINNSELQEGPIIGDVLDAMAAADTAVVTLPTAGAKKVGPRIVEIMRHTGGDTTSAASATFACNNGDQIVLVIDPNGRGDARAYLTITHSLVGLTNGSATAAQIAASINGDKNLQPFIRAVAGLTTNAVTLFPILSPPNTTTAVQGSNAPRFQITQQPAVLGFPAGFTDYAKRVYVSQTKVIAGGAGWSWAYDAGAGTITVTNSTGGAVNRVCIVVHP